MKFQDKCTKIDRYYYYVKVKMFADDVKMYMKIINDVDLVQLQCALNSLAEWAHQWQLAISIDKCCIFYWETCVISSSQS